MLTKNEYEGLIRGADQFYRNGWRDSAILMLLRYYGLTEIATMKVGDEINADKATLRTIKHYIKFFGKQKGDWLFTGRRYGKYGKPMHKNGILAVLQRSAKEHLNKHVTYRDVPKIR